MAESALISFPLYDDKGKKNLAQYIIKAAILIMRFDLPERGVRSALSFSAAFPHN